MFSSDKALRLLKKSLNVSNSMNSSSINKNLTLKVIDFYLPLSFKVAAHDTKASPVIVIAALLVSPNPVTIGSAISWITKIH